MGVPHVTKCCFVVDLKTGTTILAAVNVMLTFILLTSLIVAASIFGTLVNNEIVLLDPDAEAEATGRYVFTIILAIMFVVKFIADLLFVFGITRENTGIIKCYSIVWFVFFLLSSFIFFLHVTDYHAFTIVVELIYIGLNIYTAILAYNFYVQINSREEL